MKELILRAEVIFFKNANEYFNFPITNPIRVSFWLPNINNSTFSEFKNLNAVEIGILNIAEIKIVERDFLLNKVKIGTKFKIGVFPDAIASGKIIAIKEM